MIYLLGVYHPFQTDEYPEFMDYVRDFCQTHDIKSMGEEMSYDCLRYEKKERSTIKIIADERSIPHAYCDPGEEERQRKGIKNFSEHNRLYYNSDEELESAKIQNFQKRESIWLENIQKEFVSPMLFVCGIDHLLSFGSRLEANGFRVQQANRRWELEDLDRLRLRHAQKANPVGD